MTQELRTQRDDLVRARDLIDSRRRFTEAVLAGASAGVIGVDHDGHIQHSQSLGRAADRARRKRNSRPDAAPMSSPNLSELVTGIEGRQSAPRARADHDQPRRQGTHPVGARDERTIGRGRSRLCRDARRHHRSRQRAAHLRLGRRRAPHRARDQEPADADPAFGRAPAPQIRQGHHRGSRDLRAMHRHDRAPGRRHPPHGRRVLALLAHAEARHRSRKTWPTRSSRRCSSCGSGMPTSISRPRFPTIRMPARFDRRLISQALTNIIKNATEAISRACRKAPARAASTCRSTRDRRRDRHRRGRQRDRPAQGQSQPPARTLCHHARQRAQDLDWRLSGRSWKTMGAGSNLHDASEKVPGQRGAWMRMRIAAEPAAATDSKPEKTIQTADQ